MTRRPYQADASRIRYCRHLLAFANLVADQATDRCTAHRSDRAAARKHGTTHGTDSGANRSVFVTRGHRVTATQAEQHCCGHRTHCKSLHRFHRNASFSNFS